MSSETQIDLGDVLAIEEEVLRSTGSAGFGISDTGFVPKPYVRLVAEKIAVARRLFGDDIDLGPASVMRKVFEVASLEQARTWSTIASVYDNMFAVSAVGAALSRIGEDLGLARPFNPARGRVKLTLTPPLPPGFPQITIPRGCRMSTPGGHHIATDETAVLTDANPERTVGAVAFFPGPSHNLDPNQPNQKIDRWNFADQKLAELNDAEVAAGAPLVAIAHTALFTGGELQWSDARYRQLLLQAPRSIWTVEAVQTALSLVAGVRRVQVFDGCGGLDINQSIFGNFNFIERVFAAERDIGSPYYFTVLVAPTPAAIWGGPDGLHAQVESALEDIRPIGIFANIESAETVGVGVEAKLVVKGLPLPSGSRAAINASQAASELRARIYARLRRYVDELPFGEPVRAAEVVWTIMNEPGVVDARDVQLIRYPASFATLSFAAAPAGTTVQRFTCGQNVELRANEIPVFVDLDALPGAAAGTPPLLEIV